MRKKCTTKIIKPRFLRSSIPTVKFIAWKFKNDRTIKRLFELYILKIISIYSFCVTSLLHCRYNQDIINFCQFLLNCTTLNLNLRLEHDRSKLYTMLLANANIMELWLLRDPTNTTWQRPIKSVFNAEQTFECSVCMQQVNNLYRITLPCQHTFCLSCMIHTMFHKVVHDNLGDTEEFRNLFNIIYKYPKWFVTYKKDPAAFLNVRKYAMDPCAHPFTLFCPYRCCVTNEQFAQLKPSFSVNNGFYRSLERSLGIDP